MNKKLRITLKSDLCAATGDGYSLGVDVDCCLDQAGFPYIPGRRIKGCLREAAADIGCDALDEIFGVPGASVAGCIRVGNATLRDVAALKAAAKQEGASVASVSALFTQVRAQTAVEGDSVEDGSLRFIRVVKRYSPLNEEELVFEAPISFDDGQREQVERAVKALRNIGYHRNRGFGAVRCELVDDETAGQKTDLVKSFPDGFAYAVKLDEPLMIPQQGDASMAYVPGTSVLGFFASKLAKSLTAEEFEDLFLKDQVRFSPLYPVSQNQRALPAFGLIAKLKGAAEGRQDGQLVNLCGFETAPGEQVKPLKSGFVDACGFGPVDVATEIVYHHSTRKAAGDDATLYTQECLSAGQVLAGFVTGPQVALEKLQKALDEGVLSFGRSKTAQYSRCSLIEYTGGVPGGKTNEVSGTVVAVLDSDVLLDNGFGGYTNDAAVLLKEIASELGISAESVDKKLCSVKYRTVSGYNAKWNQKKPHVRAFAAGSFFVFEAEGSVPAEIYLGDRQAEGFGRVVVLSVVDIEPRKVEIAAIDAPAVQSDVARKWQDLLAGERTREQLYSMALNCANDVLSSKEKKETLNPSFVGRVLRMIEQADDRYDLDARIASIKNEKKRKLVQSIVGKVFSDFGDAEWPEAQEALAVLFNCVKYRVKAKGGSDE